MDLTMTNRPHLVLGVGHLDRPGVHQLRSQVLHLPRETMLWRQQLAGCWRFMVELLFIFMMATRTCDERWRRLSLRRFVRAFALKIICFYNFRWKILICIFSVCAENSITVKITFYRQTSISVSLTEEDIYGGLIRTWCARIFRMFMMRQDV